MGIFASCRERVEAEKRGSMRLWRNPVKPRGGTTVALIPKRFAGPESRSIRQKPREDEEGEEDGHMEAEIESRHGADEEMEHDQESAIGGGPSATEQGQESEEFEGESA